MNVRLIETLKTWGGELKHGTFIDSYNQIINTEISGTITTRVSASSCNFIAVKDVRKEGQNDASS